MPGSVVRLWAKTRLAAAKKRPYSICASSDSASPSGPEPVPQQEGKSCEPACAQPTPAPKKNCGVLGTSAASTKKTATNPGMADRPEAMTVHPAKRPHWVVLDDPWSRNVLARGDCDDSVRGRCISGRQASGRRPSHCRSLWFSHTHARPSGQHRSRSPSRATAASGSRTAR